MHGFDLLLLLFKGIAVASIPLAAIWIGRAREGGGDRLVRLASVTAFLTFDLIVFGAFTRLTDSGLGCPDWPGCYAKANPFMAAQEIRTAEAAMPSGPVSMNKAWIEMIHRYLAMAVGVLIVTMVIVSLWRLHQRRRDVRETGSGRPAQPTMAIGLLVLVLVQGAFGAWTVTQRLQPIFVTTHLLLGLALLAMLVWHALRLLSTVAGAPEISGALPWAVRVLAPLALVVLVLQVALGGWVSANYAVLACNDFPTCQGVWWPMMDFRQGFDPWRSLGRSSDGSFLSLAALTAIQWVHRHFAVVVLALSGALAGACWRVRRLERMGVVLGLLLIMQAATGVISVVFAWPLVAAVAHNAGAAGLLVVLVVINYSVNGARSGGLARSGSWAGRSSPRGRLDAAGP